MRRILNIFNNLKDKWKFKTLKTCYLFISSVKAIFVTSTAYCIIEWVSELLFNKHLPGSQYLPGSVLALGTLTFFLWLGWYNKLGTVKSELGLFRSSSLALHPMFSLLYLACHCHPQGSKNTVCDQITGECPCQEEVAGRSCDRCLTGYFGFPNCRPCLCNGFAELCDPETGSCFNCRGFTTGRNCER